MIQTQGRGQFIPSRRWPCVGVSCQTGLPSCLAHYLETVETWTSPSWPVLEIQGELQAVPGCVPESTLGIDLNFRVFPDASQRDYPERHRRLSSLSPKMPNTESEHLDATSDPNPFLSLNSNNMTEKSRPTREGGTLPSWRWRQEQDASREGMLEPFLRSRYFYPNRWYPLRREQELLLHAIDMTVAITDQQMADSYGDVNIVTPEGGIPESLQWRGSQNCTEESHKHRSHRWDSSLSPGLFFPAHWFRFIWGMEYVRRETCFLCFFFKLSWYSFHDASCSPPTPGYLYFFSIFYP